MILGYWIFHVQDWKFNFLDSHQINDIFFKFRNIIIKFGYHYSDLDISICQEETTQGHLQFDTVHQREPAETKT